MIWKVDWVTSISNCVLIDWHFDCVQHHVSCVWSSAWSPNIISSRECLWTRRRHLSDVRCTVWTTNILVRQICCPSIQQWTSQTIRTMSRDWMWQRYGHFIPCSYAHPICQSSNQPIKQSAIQFVTQTIHPSHWHQSTCRRLHQENLRTEQYRWRCRCHWSGGRLRRSCQRTNSQLINQPQTINQPTTYPMHCCVMQCWLPCCSVIDQTISMTQQHWSLHFRCSFVTWVKFIDLNCVSIDWSFPFRLVADLFYPWLIVYRTFCCSILLTCLLIRLRFQALELSEVGQADYEDEKWQIEC